MDTGRDTGATPAPESFKQLGKQIFIELHRTILSHESGSLDGNVESIHDMRVTVRRLRVALSNFASCHSREARKTLQSRLEHLADALGDVRDLDVMIAAMKSGLSARPEEVRSAISGLVRRLRARRRLRLRALRNYLRGEEYALFKRDALDDRINSVSQRLRSKPAEVQSDVADVMEKKHGQAA